MNSIMVRPSTLTIAVAEWPVLYNLGAWYALCQLYGDIDAVLAVARKADQEMVAAFTWAGMLHDNPALTQADVTALLDEATLAELEALPLAILAAVQSAQPNKPAEGGGEPWDWDVALAAWTTEWGQQPERFWATTFREFSALSSGRAKLYKSVRQDEHIEPIDMDPRELIQRQAARWR